MRVALLLGLLWLQNSLGMKDSRELLAVVARPGDAWSHAYLDMWQMLATTLNFTLQVREMDARLPEATWSSMLAEVQTGDAQVALAPVLMLPATAENITFSTPVHRASLSVLVRGSASEGVRWRSFLEPFSLTLWLGLLVSVLLLAFSLTVLWCSEPRRSSMPVDLQLSEALICVLGAACLQGHPQPPRCTSARVVHLSALVSAVVVVAVYSSSVTAFLAVTRDLRPFSSLDQLLTNTRFRPFTLAGSPEHSLFEESEDVSLMKHRWYTGPPSTLSSLSEALAVTCGQNASLLGVWSRKVPAFVISSLWSDSALAAAPCVLQHVPLSSGQPLWAAFPLSQHLNHIKLINRNLQSMVAAGAMIRYSEQITLRALLDRERRAAENGPVRDPRFIVKLKDVAPLLALLACGAVLALGLILLELGVSFLWQRLLPRSNLH